MQRRSSLAVLALIMAIFIMATSNTLAQSPEQVAKERQAFTQANEINDPAARLSALQGFNKTHPDSQFIKFSHAILVELLIKTSAATPEIIAAGEVAIKVDDEPAAQALTYARLALTLTQRNEQLERAANYARKADESYQALAARVDPSRLRRVREQVRLASGTVQLQKGDIAKAIETLKAIVTENPHQQESHWQLARAYEKAKQPDDAIDSYIRALAVFTGSQRDDAPLRAIYRQRVGSLSGMLERLAAAQQRSKREYAFDGRRVERPAPDWQLKDLSGKVVKFSDFKGKVVVMDFWGTWCPPCREELPIFQTLYDKYKDRVVFLSINWERPENKPPQRLKLVSDFIAKNKYTFPVVMDDNKEVVEAYNIEGFPTLLVIDAQGVVRFNNIGFEDNIQQIIEAQLEAVLSGNLE